MAILNLIGALGEYALLPWIIIGTFNREFKIFSSVWNSSQKMHGKEGHQRQVGAMWSDGQSELLGLLHDSQSAGNTTKIENIRLYDIHCTHFNHPVPSWQIAILFSSRYVNRKCISHFFSLLKLPIGAGLFIVAEAIIL